jgi:hypothetical protein
MWWGSLALFLLVSSWNLQQRNHQTDPFASIQMMDWRSSRLWPAEH